MERVGFQGCEAAEVDQQKVVVDLVGSLSDTHICRLRGVDGVKGVAGIRGGGAEEGAG